MTALSSNMGPCSRMHGLPALHRRPYGGTVANGAHIWLGSNCMQVSGAAQPVVSGSTLLALCTLMAGADGNGGIFVRAKRAGVAVAFISGAAEGITIAYASGLTDINVTYNNGTSTALTIEKLIRGHAEADKLIAVQHQGTGASSPAATSLAQVVDILPLGIADREINATGGAVTLTPDVVFSRNDFGDGTGLLVSDANLPTEGGYVALTDDASCSALPASQCDIMAPCVGVNESAGGATGIYFIDLGRAE